MNTKTSANKNASQSQTPARRGRTSVRDSLGLDMLMRFYPHDQARVEVVGSKGTFYGTAIGVTIGVDDETGLEAPGFVIQHDRNGSKKIKYSVRGVDELNFLSPSDDDDDDDEGTVAIDEDEIESDEEDDDEEESEEDDSEEDEE